MSKTYQTTFNWKLTLDCKELKTDEEVRQAGGNQLVEGKRFATDRKMIQDAIRMMESQTIATFQQEMADRGVTDYQFGSIKSTANMTVKPYAHREPDFWILGGPIKVSTTIEGTSVITFDDILPIAITAIVFAISGAIVTHASLIVLVAILTFVAIVAVTVYHVVVTDIATGISTVSEGIKTATSTTGGTIVTALLVIGTVIVAGALFVVFALPKLKSKFSKQKENESSGMRY